MRNLWIAALLATAAVTACDRTPAPKPAAVVDAAFLRDHAAWRAGRRANLLQPDGWTSLVGLHWIDRGAHYVGASGGNGIRLAHGPAHLGMIELNPDGGLRFVPDRGAALTLDGAPLRRTTALRADADPAGASVLGFDDGRGLATVIKRGDRYALRVKHADATTRTAFGELDYYPPSPAWTVDARYVAHAPGTTLPIANIIGTVDAVPNPGVLEFERGGRAFRLQALDEGDGGLFVVFADRTSGHGSYGAGRFLDAPRPDARGRVRLDFNRAYNPPCAFTAFATCPLPPNENRLDLRVEAGEKTYRAPPRST